MQLKQKIITLSCAVFFLAVPGMPVHAVEAGDLTTVAGLCSHHTQHTSECLGQTPCSHEHTRDCYREITECTHIHSAACRSGNGSRGYANCTHTCSQINGCITLNLSCAHEHNDDCLYAEGSTCSYSCTSCHEAAGSTSQGQSRRGHHRSHHLRGHHC